MQIVCEPGLEACIPICKAKWAALHQMYRGEDWGRRQIFLPSSLFAPPPLKDGYYIPKGNAIPPLNGISGGVALAKILAKSLRVYFLEYDNPDHDPGADPNDQNIDQKFRSPTVYAVLFFDQYYGAEWDYPNSSQYTGWRTFKSFTPIPLTTVAACFLYPNRIMIFAVNEAVLCGNVISRYYNHNIYASRSSFRSQLSFDGPSAWWAGGGILSKNIYSYGKKIVTAPSEVVGIFPASLTSLTDTLVICNDGGVYRYATQSFEDTPTIVSTLPAEYVSPSNTPFIENYANGVMSDGSWYYYFNGYSLSFLKYFNDIDFGPGWDWGGIYPWWELPGISHAMFQDSQYRSALLIPVFKNGNDVWCKLSIYEVGFYTTFCVKSGFIVGDIASVVVECMMRESRLQSFLDNPRLAYLGTGSVPQQMTDAIAEHPGVGGPAPSNTHIFQTLFLPAYVVRSDTGEPLFESRIKKFTSVKRLV